MRLLDHDEPIDPQIAATLDAIDATLAGEPVDARYAEVAEIALLLTAERPSVPEAFAQSMDERVARRFAPAASPPRRSARWWRMAGFWEATGALTAAVALIVGLVIVTGGHGHGSSASFSTTSSSASSSAARSSSVAPSSSATPALSAGTASAARGAPHRTAGTPASSAGAVRTPASQQSASAGAPAATASTPTPPPLQPPTNGRKVVQSAQLQLAAAPDRIDDVAQEVYDVIGQLNGVVESSTVTQTGGPDGSANFQLSVPSASLGQAMTQLSSLNYASVLSRTDSSQDITDEYGAAKRALADARALRTSLLKQLANATTTEQVDSLKAQIRDAEASISSDEATLARLNRQVGFSQLGVQINARSAPAPVTHHSTGGFGIGRAAHDAGRVLTVAAGVALIVLAGLTPVALLAALAWWVGAALRRRRREQALDSA